jgi:hypothetical protein
MEKMQLLNDLVRSIVKSFEYMIKAAGLEIENLSKDENYFMAKIVKIKEEVYHFYHAFEEDASSGFLIFGYNVEKDFGKDSHAKFDSNSVLEMTDGIKYCVQKATIEIRSSEISTQIGLNYKDLQKEEKDAVWSIYTKRGEITNFVKSKL